MIPFSGGSGRIYESINIQGYDIFASITCSVPENKWSDYLREASEIKKRYDQCVIYSHCQGALTALELAKNISFDKAIFGAYMPSLISSVFGKPINGWKHISDQKLLATLQQNGLKHNDSEIAIQFRKDIDLTSKLNVKQTRINLPVTVILADVDPFVPNPSKAVSRWQKRTDQTITTIVLQHKDHYFVSDNDFINIIEDILKNHE